MEEDKKRKMLIIILITVSVLVLCEIVLVIISKNSKQANNNNTIIENITNETNETEEPYEPELETLNIYKYKNGKYGTEERYEDSYTYGEVVNSIECSFWTKGAGILVAYGANKFYYFDLEAKKPKLEELPFNKSYTFDKFNIKIDVYSNGKNNGYVLNDYDNISTDYQHRETKDKRVNNYSDAGGPIKYNNIEYWASFDIKTLEKGYIALTDDDNKTTTIYNINNNKEELKLEGIYYFYTYDNDSFALYSSYSDEKLEMKGLEKLKYSIYDKDFNKIKTFEITESFV